MQHRLNPILAACALVIGSVAWLLSLRVPVPLDAPDALHAEQAQSGPLSEKVAVVQKATSGAAVDPFWPVVEAPKPVVQQVLPPPPPLPPPRPTLPFRFFGRVTNPDGREAIFVSHENEQYEIKPGAILEGQFKVVSIDVTQIVFEHISTGDKLEMALPAVPSNNSGSGF